MLLIMIELMCDDVDCRAAQLQALQAPTNYYQQTPLQQTGFYQAQQTGSALQVTVVLVAGVVVVVVVVVIVVVVVVVVVGALLPIIRPTVSI